MRALPSGRPTAAEVGGNMLEGGGGGKAQGFLQLFDKLPCVQRVQEIDITGLAVKDGHRQFAAVPHENPGGLLVRVAAVFQF